MALEKTGYTPATLGTTKVKIGIDENGYIASGQSVAVGTKTFQINRANADNTLEDNQDVLNFFIGLVDGRGDSDTNTMSVIWEV